MASITIRNLDDDVKTRLRIRASASGRSMEEEARLILESLSDAVGAPGMTIRALGHPGYFRLAPSIALQEPIARRSPRSLPL